jgi:hypothetical protein
MKKLLFQFGFGEFLESRARSNILGVNEVWKHPIPSGKNARKNVENRKNKNSYNSDI